MMNSDEYVTLRDNILQRQSPHIVLDKKELAYEGENYYNARGTHIRVTHSVQQALDRLIGLSPRQCDGIRQAYGDEAVANLRNSFAMANCVNNPKSFALIANPDGHIVDGMVTLADEAIPMRSFFDILEMIADRHGYEIERIDCADNPTCGINVVLMPVTPRHDVTSDDDEFITNGLYAKWNLGEIELGNYYLRLVCSNGQMQLSKNALRHIHSARSAAMMAMLDTDDMKRLIKHNWDSFKTAADTARATTASLAEMHRAKTMLVRHGAPDDLAEQLIPYFRLLDTCRSKGINAPESQIKSGTCVWEIFNTLTNFASYNDVWQPSDIRSASLMQKSIGLLMAKRDIKTYYDLQ